MNAYEKMKDAFLLEVDHADLGITADQLNGLAAALDRAAYAYDVRVKETAISVQVDPIPMLVKTYIVVKKTEGLSVGTLQNYARTLADFFLWCRKTPEEVVPNDIRMYLYHYAQQRRITDRTLDKYRAYICWFFGWAHSEEYMNHNPARSIKPIKFELKERKALTQMELEYLRMACRTKRDRAIVEVLYSTGCRVSELTVLKKSDVDWNEGTVHLFGKGKKHRTSFLNAKAIVALREYLDSRIDRHEALFATIRSPFRAMKKASVEMVIRKISDRAGLPKTVTPHVLRHTTATQAVNAGMPIEDVSKLLGHASVNTTMIYAKTSNGKVQAEHVRCIV